MSADTKGNWYGKPKDWSKLVSGAGTGAAQAIEGLAKKAQTKKELKEAKRRTLANLLNQALQSEQGLFQVGQNYNEDIADTRNQSLQQTARGFIDALSGSTGAKRQYQQKWG